MIDQCLQQQGLSAAVNVLHRQHYTHTKLGKFLLRNQPQIRSTTDLSEGTTTFAFTHKYFWTVSGALATDSPQETGVIAKSKRAKFGSSTNQCPHKPPSSLWRCHPRLTTQTRRSTPCRWYR